jgi:uncharacterized protein
MTGLVLDSPGQRLSIRSVGERGIRVADTFFTRSLLISGEQLRDDWAPQTLADITAPALEPVFELRPELVLLGTGSKQRFLAPDLLGEFYRRGIGVEVMTTEAACRTFNVLVADGRAVVAALLPLTT